jgi:hypothetical protein
VESSRANLKLQGLLPQGEASREDLDRALLDGRYSELRMLYYVGKGSGALDRAVSRIRRAQSGRPPPGICFQSFAGLLDSGSAHRRPGQAPQVGRRRLQIDLQPRAWIAYHVRAAPPREVLSDEFVRSYFRFADQIFQSKQSECDFTPLTSREFHFELYSSGEYSRMLERSWGE